MNQQQDQVQRKNSNDYFLTKYFSIQNVHVYVYNFYYYNIFYILNLTKLINILFLV
jgi:hypothetical protein